MCVWVCLYIMHIYRAKLARVAGVALLLSNKINFKTKMFNRDNDGNFTRIKGSIYQKPSGVTTRICSFCKCVWHHARHIQSDQQMRALSFSVQKCQRTPRPRGECMPGARQPRKAEKRGQSRLPRVGLWLRPQSSEAVESEPGHGTHLSQRDSSTCAARKALQGWAL